ncbi:MAG: UDP-N-acetylmuramate--L-alanine ligase [Bacteroidetes bacterium]|nr:MAG: UDP-N-acetylmuramate--L-alanine ligase [Bacteroidota bacterium]
MKKQAENIYFLGIGGIGMSALARYYHSIGVSVWGYDLTETPLTKKLEESGITVNYSDDIGHIPNIVRSNPETPIIYTPAIPNDNNQFNYFKKNGFSLRKRADVLGEISKDYKTIAIAGTHGKTTTSAMAAHIMHQSRLGCMAFVGGVMSGYESNVILDTFSEWVVVEADEYDRSFLKLHPYLLGITSIDPDHLDIYTNAEGLNQAFNQLIKQTNPENKIIVNDVLDEEIISKSISYGFSKSADIRLSSQGYQNGFHHVKVFGLDDQPVVLELAMPGLHNAQNAVLAAILCKKAGCTTDEIKAGLSTFKGVKRRFEFILKSEKTIFIDDYAHHPTEIDALILSVRNLYPNKKITGIFQPHLYSRTSDFADDFAQSLSKLDQLYLLEIYPARELPIPGIDANFLLDKVKLNQKSIVDKQNVAVLITENKPEILLSIGAGDIGQLVPAVKQALMNNNG